LLSWSVQPSQECAAARVALLRRRGSGRTIFFSKGGWLVGGEDVGFDMRFFCGEGAGSL
jgi:hypothetical protein